jgi:hypothetical protein
MEDIMEVIETKSVNDKVKRVKKLILSAGNKIGSVHFTKRSDGTKRRMCYRLHAQNTSYAPRPSGKSIGRRQHDSDNLQMTVLDVNKVLRAPSGRRKGKISGRGAWRTIPLETVSRIKVNGQIYKIK